MSKAGILKKLMLLLKEAPRDDTGRVLVSELPAQHYEDLLGAPEGLGNLVFRGEHSAPTKGPLWVARSPAHALYYAAEYGGMPKTGYMSVFEAPWAELPVLDEDIFDLAMRTGKPSDGFNARAVQGALSRVGHDAPGVRLEDILDYRFTQDSNKPYDVSTFGASEEHRQPQALIWNTGVLQRRKNGGLIK